MEVLLAPEAPRRKEQIKVSLVFKHIGTHAKGALQALVTVQHGLIRAPVDQIIRPGHAENGVGIPHAVQSGMLAILKQVGILPAVRVVGHTVVNVVPAFVEQNIRVRSGQHRVGKHGNLRLFVRPPDKPLAPHLRRSVFQIQSRAAPRKFQRELKLGPWLPVQRIFIQPQPENGTVIACAQRIPRFLLDGQPAHATVDQNRAALTLHKMHALFFGAGNQRIAVPAAIYAKQQPGPSLRVMEADFRRIFKCLGGLAKFGHLPNRRRLLKRNSHRISSCQQVKRSRPPPLCAAGGERENVIEPDNGPARSG